MNSPTGAKMATARAKFADFEAASRPAFEEDPVDENGFPIMTHKVVHRIVYREFGGYIEPSINDVVHLENRRWREIRDLNKYTGVTVLHLENNQIGPAIGNGLAHMSKLKALYLQCNMVKQVDSLAANQKLTLLNVATNQISGFAEGGLPHSLNTLLVSANNISTAAALAPLASLPNLEVLDLSRNNLEGGDEAFELFARMPALRVLYLQHNPIQKTEYYRRRLVSGCRRLTYLDDTPVETAERVGAEAWAASGGSFDAERTARRKLVEDRRAAAKAATRRMAAERAARRAAANLGSDDSGRRVLSEEAMAAVPGTVTLDDGWAKALGGDECPVCQARLKAGERAIALQQCGHAFHLACLRPWLTRASATCPLCRAEVATPSAAAIAAAATDKREGRNAGTKDEANPGPNAGTKDEEDTKDNGDIVDESHTRWISHCPRSNYVFSNTTNQSSVMRGEAPELSAAARGSSQRDGVDDEAQDEVRRAIQTQLRKRFSQSHISSERKKSEADQSHSLDAFARLRAERAEARSREREVERSGTDAGEEGAAGDGVKADSMSVEERIALAQKLAAGDGDGDSKPST